MSDKGESWSEGRSYGRTEGWSSAGKSRSVSVQISLSGGATFDPHGEATRALLERMMRERLDGEQFVDGAGI